MEPAAGPVPVSPMILAPAVPMAPAVQAPAPPPTMDPKRKPRKQQRTGANLGRDEDPPEWRELLKDKGVQVLTDAGMPVDKLPRGWVSGMFERKTAYARDGQTNKAADRMFEGSNKDGTLVKAKTLRDAWLIGEGFAKTRSDVERLNRKHKEAHQARHQAAAAAVAAAPAVKTAAASLAATGMGVRWGLLPAADPAAASPAAWPITWLGLSSDSPPPVNAPRAVSSPELSATAPHQAARQAGFAEMIDSDDDDDDDELPINSGGAPTAPAAAAAHQTPPHADSLPQQVEELD